VVRKSVFSVVVAVVLVGCGKGVPVINSPADGQKIFLDQTPQFQVSLADNDYQDTTIEVRGAEQLPGELTCTPGNYGPAQCFRSVTTQFGSFSQSCTAQAPCQLVLIARRGDKIDVKTVLVARSQNGGFGGAPTQPR